MDPLENCIVNMFSDKEPIEEVEPTEEENEMESVVLHNEVVESINDDYTGYSVNEAIDDGDRVDVEPSQLNKDRSVPILATKDVFAEGRQKMIDMNIPLMRERKKLRERRANVFS